MKQIPLTQNKVALIDDEDYELVGRHKWYAHSSNYACRDVGRGRNKKCIYMHREIINAPDNFSVDHINHNGLDNQKENLRICTKAENCRYQKPCRNRVSEYKGVYWHTKNRKWIAQITYNYKGYYLGSFTDEIEAAKAYDRTAERMFGKFALLNFPKG